MERKNIEPKCPKCGSDRVSEIAKEEIARRVMYLERDEHGNVSVQDFGKEELLDCTESRMGCDDCYHEAGLERFVPEPS